MVAIALLASAPAAHALPEPQWVKDLRAKADAYKQRLNEALDRLKQAAAAAGDKLAADAKARLAELIEILEGQLRAVEQLIAEQAREYEAVIYARLEEAVEVADELSRELGEVLAGTRQRLDVDRRRLVVGTRQIVASSLREAGVLLSDAHVVNDRVIADAARELEAEARRWLGLVVAGGGVLAMGLAAGLIWQRRRTASRWILTGVGAAVIAGGTVAVVLGIRHWRAEPETLPAVVGLTRCDALAGAQQLIDAGRAPAPARTQAVVALERCQLLVADGTTAVLIDDRLRKLRKLPE